VEAEAELILIHLVEMVAPVVVVMVVVMISHQAQEQ
jgi:hypothetical protein